MIREKDLSFLFVVFFFFLLLSLSLLILLSGSPRTSLETLPSSKQVFLCSSISFSLSSQFVSAKRSCYVGKSNSYHSLALLTWTQQSRSCGFLQVNFHSVFFFDCSVSPWTYSHRWYKNKTHSKTVPISKQSVKCGDQIRVISQPACWS